MGKFNKTKASESFHVNQDGADNVDSLENGNNDNNLDAQKADAQYAVDKATSPAQQAGEVARTTAGKDSRATTQQLIIDATQSGIAQGTVEGVQTAIEHDVPVILKTLLGQSKQNNEQIVGTSRKQLTGTSINWDSIQVIDAEVVEEPSPLDRLLGGMPENTKQITGVGDPAPNALEETKKPGKFSGR